MKTLTSTQRSRLKSIAHHLKPALHIGKEGLSEAALRHIEAAFGTHELLKLKVLDTAPEDARTTARKIAGGLEGVHLVHVIGRTAVLYRRNPESPEIELDPQ